MSLQVFHIILIEPFHATDAQNMYKRHNSCFIIKQKRFLFFYIFSLIPAPCRFHAACPHPSMKSWNYTENCLLFHDFFHLIMFLNLTLGAIYTIRLIISSKLEIIQCISNLFLFWASIFGWQQESKWRILLLIWIKFVENPLWPLGIVK
jgi:hypothetical protein